MDSTSVKLVLNFSKAATITNVINSQHMCLNFHVVAVIMKSAES